MASPENDPLIRQIDELLEANPSAVFPRDDALRLPPSCLRLVTVDHQPVTVTRRNPLQMPSDDYYDRRAQIEYDICQDVQLDLPLTLYRIPLATQVSAIYHSVTNPGWRLYASRKYEPIHGPVSPEAARLPKGLELDGGQLEQLAGMLATAQVVDTRNNPRDKKLWSISLINAVGVQSEVLGFGGLSSLTPGLDVDDFGF